ncbi:uncharacterized protein [Leptinotarsa decemlineata]|uniref:uncharacterized protein n=1 Tax=Leptinotarsa decemlineata TaxID=7539 RepID=UPI003D305E0F
MFGVPAKIALKTLSLPDDVLENISTEEDLEELVKQIEENQSGPDSVEHEDAVDEPNELLLAQIPEQPSVNEPNSIPEEPASNEITERQDSVAIKRAHAEEGLEEQAKKMLKTSNVRFPPGNVDDTVKLRVPDVDRARRDCRNVLAVIMCVQNELYELGTKEGRLPQMYSRNQLTLCKESFISLDMVPNLHISLREYVKKTSLSGGQGYQRCVCKTKCKTDKCKCKKNGKLCNSKCHESLSCHTKFASCY